MYFSHKTILILACCFFLGCKESSLPTQSLKTIPAELDFGTVANIEEFEWTFQVTNVTSSPLTVTKFHTNCGCLEVAPSKIALESGESSSVKITLNPEQMQEYRANQELRFLIHPAVESLDPISWELKGKLGANVNVEESDVISRFVDLGEVSKNSQHLECTLDVEIDSIKSISASEGIFDVVESSINPDDRKTIRLELVTTDLITVNLPDTGRFKQRFDVKFEKSDDVAGGTKPAEMLSVLAIGRFKADVYASPDSLMLGMYREGEIARGSAVVASMTGKALSVTQIAPSDNSIKASVERRDESSVRLNVEMRIDSGTSDKAVSLELIAEEKKVELTVPIKVNRISR